MVLLHLKHKIICSWFLSHHSYSDFIYHAIEIPTSYLNFEIQKLLKATLDTSSGWRRKRSPYLSRELQISRKQASSFSSPGHRSAHFYFLCCLFNVCKLGRAWQAIESVKNTHRDFDAYFYRKKVRIIHG